LVAGEAEGLRTKYVRENDDLEKQDELPAYIFHSSFHICPSPCSIPSSYPFTSLSGKLTHQSEAVEALWTKSTAWTRVTSFYPGTKRLLRFTGI
jgi:hypothetical protein